MNYIKRRNAENSSPIAACEQKFTFKNPKFVQVSPPHSTLKVFGKRPCVNYTRFSAPSCTPSRSTTII